ncbi:sulfite exporter TauE/SafE family protein [Haloferula chungangensis]|uniref:Probable membrane transporter protein n=1 Tax=Haloferula chungangensis TaxID=1048331 RepID=A0ABW2L5U3_9BACT
MSEVALHLSILILAFLYSSVGHAGASGYIAAMTLAGIAVPEIRPAALMMNLGVSIFGMWHFVRGGHFRWSLTWPFLVAALPFAFLGGKVSLPPQILGLVLGSVLLFSAIRFLFPNKASSDEPKAPKTPIALIAGAILGYLAGLTGTGGGIFLTPLLLIAGWATPKTAAATSIVFIAGNSLSGILGFSTGPEPIPWHLASLFPFALVGGFAGSRLGSYHFSATTIRRLLAVVLLLASVKLLGKVIFP